MRCLGSIQASYFSLRLLDLRLCHPCRLLRGDTSWFDEKERSFARSVYCIDSEKGFRLQIHSIRCKMPGVGPDGVMPIDSIEDDFMRKKEEMYRVAKDCLVVIDNLPKIGPEKYEKLVNKLTPMFEKSARMRRDEQDAPRLTFVRADNGSTLGFALAEYITPEEAAKAVASLHNFQLDRSHRFWVCTAGELERLQSIKEEFVPPPPLPVTLKNRPNFKSWLLDERGRDQFMIRHNHETSVYWHDHIVKPQLVSSFSQICSTHAIISLKR